MLATIDKADLEPREAAAIEGTDKKGSARDDTGNPRLWVERSAPQKE